MKEIESSMQLNPGEGEEYIRDLIDAMNINENERQGSMVPIIDLTWGDGLQIWLGSSESRLDLSLSQPIDLVLSCYR